jgi:hypothetical protein
MPEPDSLPFRRPADYYASPEKTLRPLFPKWVSIGCGSASLFFVAVLFVAGAFAPRSGSALGWVFGQLQTDMSAHFTADVTPDQRAAFAAEMNAVRASAAAGKLKLETVQSFLKLATEVDADDKIDHTEADKLIAALREVNRGTRSVGK